MNGETLFLGVAVFALTVLTIWLANREFNGPTPPPPPDADFQVQMRYWLDKAADQGFYPGCDPRPVRQWAQNIPDTHIRDCVIDILD